MIPAMNLDPSFPSRYFCGTLAKFVTRHFSFPLLLLMMMFGNLDVAVGHAQAPPQDASASDWTRVPEADWARVKPEAAGYSSARLEALRAWLKTQQTTAMLVAVHGNVIFEYGDLSRVSKVASVRKSVLAMLYGNYVVSGKIDTDKTVKELGKDDTQPFLPIEEHATLEQLLVPRSGIYLPNGSYGQDEATPKRGSEYPGTHFFYNNWDFNAAGAAFEKLTGKNIYDALENDLARPIGRQDFVQERQKKIPTKVSVHPEYAMSLSTRDTARLGLLMGRLGRWNDRQVHLRTGAATSRASSPRLKTSIPLPFAYLGGLIAGAMGHFGGYGMPSFLAISLMGRFRGRTAPWDPGGNLLLCCLRPTW
jgi:CubicO group peptidase (beta-lactamase class C family)